MEEPDWIPKEALFAVHSELLARFGGPDGIRDEGLLESALARPKQLFAYGNPSLFEMAAAYADGIVNNHPFVDGNKRSGFMAAYIFLGINGFSLEAPEEEAVLQTLALASGKLDGAAFAAWLEASCQKKSHTI